MTRVDRASLAQHPDPAPGAAATGFSWPSARALGWAANALAPGARVVAVDRLEATAQPTHALTVLAPGGSEQRVVLRRWMREGWEDDDPDFTPAHEARVLDLLARTPVPAPHALALDVDGSQSGSPALLMSVVAGSPPPAGTLLGSHLTALAAALRVMHTLPVTAAQVGLIYRRYYRAQRLEPPGWGRDPSLWGRALAAIRVRPAEVPGCLVHRDFHPGNTLWQGARLTGVVDWAQASWGPAQLDLAHLRWNLAVDYGVPAAEALLAEYERLSGAGGAREQAYWDLVATYDVVPELDPALLKSESLDALEAFVGAAVGRL